ncbi:MAG: transporter, family, lactate transporter [Acetobacteraceae bacterium]|nr:transporter, family, lactate transporter [Acetobacteraceae bacterium]
MPAQDWPREAKIPFDAMIRELHLTPAAVGWPLACSNALTFLFSFVWGSLADSIGRRWAMIIPALIGVAVAPIYLLTSDYMTIAIAFSIQGAFAGAIYGINPSYSAERFPTEIRATAAGFCYHVGAAIGGGLVPPILTYFAVDRHMGFAVPMRIGNGGWFDQLRHYAVLQSGDKRQGNGTRSADPAAGGDAVGRPARWAETSSSARRRPLFPGRRGL